MSPIFKIAWRNTRRHRMRTLLSALTIAVGLMLFLYMDSLFAGMDRGAIDNMIELSVSAVKVQSKAYAEDRDSLPLENGIDNLEAVVAHLKTHPQVEAVAPRTSFMAELSREGQSIPVVGTVLSPTLDPTVFSLSKHVSPGWLSEERDDQVILGYQLAKELNVKAGDFITVYALTKHGSHNADEFQIVGLLETSDPGLNKSSVLLSQAAGEKLLELGGLVTELNVRLQKRKNLSDLEADMVSVKKHLEKDWPALTGQTYLDLGATYLAVTKTKRSFGWIFMGVILLIAGVGIFNSVLMSVFERIREIGVLRAHGVTPGQVMGMFLLEGVFTGVLGSVMGLIAGGILVYLMVNYGLPMDKLAGDDVSSGMPVWGTIYGQWNPLAMVFAFSFGVLVAMVAGIWPAARAGRLTVTAALRHV